MILCRNKSEKKLKIQLPNNSGDRDSSYREKSKKSKNSSMKSSPGSRTPNPKTNSKISKLKPKSKFKGIKLSWRILLPNPSWIGPEEAPTTKISPNMLKEAPSTSIASSPNKPTSNPFSRKKTSNMKNKSKSISKFKGRLKKKRKTYWLRWRNLPKGSIKSWTTWPWWWMNRVKTSTTSQKKCLRPKRMWRLPTSTWIKQANHKRNQGKST